MQLSMALPKTLACLTLAGSSVSVLVAQNFSQRIAGPALGFVFDRSVGIRPLLGVPGAAVAGPALAFDAGIQHMEVSSERDYALAIAGPDRRLLLFRDLAGVPTPALVPGVSGSVDRIALSPAATAALLYAAGENSLQILTGLPGAPRSLSRIPLSGLPVPVQDMAVSDAGDAALLALGEAGRGAVYILTPGGGDRFVVSGEGPFRLTFLNRSADALIADAAGSTVFLFRRAGAEFRLLPAFGAEARVSRPVAVAASSDNRRAFVANAEPPGVVAIGLDDGTATALPCYCAPAGLTPLSGDSLFLVSSPSADVLWILDGRPGATRLLAVPPIERPLARSNRAEAPGRIGGAR